MKCPSAWRNRASSWRVYYKIKAGRNSVGVFNRLRREWWMAWWKIMIFSFVKRKSSNRDSPKKNVHVKIGSFSTSGFYRVIIISGGLVKMDPFIFLRAKSCIKCLSRKMKKSSDGYNQHDMSIQSSVVWRATEINRHDVHPSVIRQSPSACTAWRHFVATSQVQSTAILRLI